MNSVQVGPGEVNCGAHRRGVEANNEFGDFGFSANGNKISSARGDMENLEHNHPRVQRAENSFYDLRFTCG